MSRIEDEELENFRRDAQRKQHHGRTPKKIADAMSSLLSRRGFARVMSVSAFTEVWLKVVGEKLGSHTRAGEVKRGVLEVTVRNSAVMQELTFAKMSIIKQLAAAAPDQKVSNLRFRVGPID